METMENVGSNINNLINNATTKVIGNMDQVEQPTTNEQKEPTMEPTKSVTEKTPTNSTNNVITEEAWETATSSPPQQTSVAERKSVEFDEQAFDPSKRRQVKNPFKTLIPRVTQLVYWENPTYSGAVLAVGLSFLIYTTYYSLFNTFCALASTLIGANWIYVIGRKQLQAFINQEPVNPHEHLLANKPWYIERAKLEKYLDVTTEAVNFLLQEIQRIVLVDDPMRTIKYVVIFYVSWTLGGWINFRTFFGIGLVLGFVTPVAYKENKVLVDEKLDQANKFLHSHLDRGLVIAKQHTGGVYEKAKSFAVNKGLVNKGAFQNTKKEE